MADLLCNCGCRITLGSPTWHGDAYLTVFRHAETGIEIHHCPRCNTALYPSFVLGRLSDPAEPRPASAARVIPLPQRPTQGASS